MAEIRGWQITGLSLTPVLVNKVLMDHSYPYLFTYCLWLPLDYKGRVDRVERL